MSENPTLILQMQRMGDLIMTFPLMGYLQALEPQHPLWIVAEPCFFQDLLHIAPKATFFPPTAAPQLRHQSYHRIINLSHRPDAADLSGSLRCSQRLGPYTQDGVSHIAGFWQLYRSSLVQNNRHNLFHWTDLNLMDCLAQGDTLPRIAYPPPKAAQRGCVGIFTGASEPLKRPSPALLGAVTKGLLRKGFTPLFLGGPGDLALGIEAQEQAGIAGSNLCGRFSLQELTGLMQSLDLFITADTGPMHLAVWAGTPTLNLSMGPVNAWETGPASPQHYVLRSTASCTGCWQCLHAEPVCHKAFQPSRIVLAAHAIIRAPQSLERLHFPALQLLRSQRDERGLYRLEPVGPHNLRPRDILSRFWQEFFMSLSGRQSTAAEVACAELASCSPRLLEKCQAHLVQLSKQITRHLNSTQHEQQAPHSFGNGRIPLPAHFWQLTPPALRPLSGFVHLLLQNEEYSPSAWDKAMEAIALCATMMQLANKNK